MPGGRKKPFSGKQKKEQLKAKKGQPGLLRRDEDEEDARIVRKGPTAGPASLSVEGLESSKFFESKVVSSRMNTGRYALTFRAESREELAKLKEQARETIRPVAEEYLECVSGDFYNPHLDFPTRPQWNYDLSREELERTEGRYFQEYLKKIEDKFESSELSYFELNLETWRQFWRVLEMSDILLCIVDVRYPPLLFPPKLYDYVCKELGKQMILVLNKVDMCPAPIVLAWEDYFRKSYEGLEVLCFTSYPSYNLRKTTESATGMAKGKRVRGRLHMAAEGAMEVYKVCEKLVQSQVDLSKWKQKILEEINTSEANLGDEEEDLKIDSVETLQKQDTGYYEHKKFNGGILTIGCVGQPNVGKSSLINALMGKKVVSVSKTPGHTKHFQTIFLTPNVRLCDCPGLIFPSKVPKPLQVLCGSYPIAQLREPYSTVQYLAQRLDLPKLMGLQHPEGKDETEWSAFDIADGWALKRRYYTAKAARLDSYRGANHILRLALEGRICLCLRPPGYKRKKVEYGNDPRIGEILRIQAKFDSDKSANVDEGHFALSLSESEEDDTELSTPPVPKPEDYVPKPKPSKTKEPELNNDEEDEESEEEIISKPVKSKNKKNPSQNKFSLLMEGDNSSD